MLDWYGLPWRKGSLGRLPGKPGTEAGEVDEAPLLEDDRLTPNPSPRTDSRMWQRGEQPAQETELRGGTVWDGERSLAGV